MEKKNSQALNLEAIQNALDQHAKVCNFAVIEIRLNPFEVERLGWEDYKGIPIVGDEKLGTGRIKIICDRNVAPGKAAKREVSEPVAA